MADYQGTREEVDRSVLIPTFQDLVDHLEDIGLVDRGDRAERMLFRAAQEAVRDLPHRHEWAYLHRRAQVTTVAPYSTGTITYDHTGGTNELEITLASGTWPAWARHGRILISSVMYNVDDRVSDTVLTLSARSNPGVDVAAGTSYELTRQTYPLPWNFSVLTHLVEMSTGTGPAYVELDVLLANLGINYNSAWPRMFAIHNDNEMQGGVSISFSSPPEAARVYDISYRANCGQLLVERYSEGTITINGAPTATTTIEGTGTTFTSAHVNCLLRVGDATNEPTGPAGNLRADGIFPHAVQRMIRSVTDADTLEVDSSIDADHTTVKYTISTPLDIEQGAMYNLLLRMAESKLIHLLRARDEYEVAARAEYEAMIEAKGADMRMEPSVGGGAQFEIESDLFLRHNYNGAHGLGVL